MKIHLIFISSLVFFSMLSCNDAKVGSSNYDESLDDIVLGIYFGMEQKDFLDHCWELNQEGKTGHGTIGNQVMYVDSLNFDPKVIINFYPKFEENVISEMPFQYNFHAWAPWNKNELTQEKLYQQVIKFFEKKYNTTLEKKDAPNGKYLHLKQLGPIMIRVFKDIDEMKVNADIRHLNYRKKSKND